MLNHLNSPNLAKMGSSFPYMGAPFQMEKGLEMGRKARFIQILDRFLQRSGQIAEIPTQELNSAVHIEIEFATRVLDACDQWNRKGPGIVYWDVDDTQGIGIKIPHTGRNQWLVRPSMPFLTSYIANEFPNLTHGILSFRDQKTLRSDLAVNGRLGVYSDFFSKDHINAIGDVPSLQGVLTQFEKAKLTKEFGERSVKKALCLLSLSQTAAPSLVYLIDDFQIPPMPQLDGIVLCVGNFLPKAAITPFVSSIGTHPEKLYDLRSLADVTFNRSHQTIMTPPPHGIDGNKYWVQGVADPLSNFYHSPLLFGGERFGSVEAFVQTIKYKEADPFRKKIQHLWGSHAKRSAKRSNRAFHLQREIDPGSIRMVYWKGKEIPYGSEEHVQLVEGAVRAKFEQNEQAREALLATGSLELCHDPSTRSRLLKLGTLAPKHIFNKGEDAALPNKKFVEILTQIRNELP